MNLKLLKKEIPYKWKVQSFSKFKPMATCVAYIDARDVQDILDEVCEQQNWKDYYKEVKNNLYAGIGIKVGDEWIVKWGCGVESDYEKEKGEASDAFKRAGVKWGIGRFLYSLKIQYVTANEKKTEGNHPYCIKDTGERIYDLTEYINSKKHNIEKKPEERKPTFIESVEKIKNKVPPQEFDKFCKEFEKEFGVKNWEKMTDRKIQEEFFKEFKQLIKIFKDQEKNSPEKKTNGELPF